MTRIGKFFITIGESLTTFLNKIRTRLGIGHCHSLSLPRKVLMVFGIVIMLIYPVSAFLAHRIDDDLEFRAPPEDNASLLVANTVALINREVVDNTWIANKPKIFPQALLLDNMPNYQIGIIQGLEAAVKGIAMHFSSIRISDAATKLGKDGRSWGFGKDSAVKSYISAGNTLQEEAFAIGMDKELFTLLSGELSSALAVRIEASGKVIEENTLFKTDNYFYHNKGLMYAMYILLRAANEELQEQDASEFIDKEVAAVLELLATAVNYDPVIVYGMSSTPSVLSNHLLVQTYYMMKIRDGLSTILRMKDTTNE